MKKKNSVSFSNANYDQIKLIQLAQTGNQEAWDKIVAYHEKRMKAYAYILIPEYASSIQTADLEAAFYEAIQNAVTSFRPGAKRFESYFLSVFSHGLTKVLDEYGYFTPGRVISLEEPICNSDDDDVLVFADKISESDDMSFLDSAHIENTYKAIVCEVDDDLTMRIVDMRREGKTFQEIAERLGVTTKTAWNKFQKFLSVAKRLIKHSL
ncbi:MAG: hypothetical protein MJ238_01850 [Bacilli bacterium]|nr:hypothetical protein [Bacilli bacterium]